jgi:glycosyltransferase involved in cell wall biosynthesis/GT2 family glycosyltransferase
VSPRASDRANGPPKHELQQAALVPPPDLALGAAVSPRGAGTHGRNTLREQGPDQSLCLERGECAVVIPVYGGYEYFTECLESVLAHTPEHVSVVIADDASIDPNIGNLLRHLSALSGFPLRVTYIRQPRNLGFVGNANCLFTCTAPADVVILNSDCVVSEGWYQGLRDAAYSDSTVATATALTNHGTVLSVPHRNRPIPDLPQDWTIDQAATSVRRASPRLRPRIPTAVGHCVYIRRTALDLVGGFDETFAPGYGEEVDFSQRCIARGLCHVVADDVFVLHHGSGTFGVRSDITRIQADHERIIHARYPHYQHHIQELQRDTTGPLARSLSAARRALTGMSVTIDGTCLGPHLTGTQLHILELIGALSRLNRLRLRVVLPKKPGEYVADLLGHVRGVETVSIHERDLEPTDIVHRPYQIGYISEFNWLRTLGDRLVITHQDLIAYRNPAYFANYWRWAGYRRTAGDTLSLADGVICFSSYVAQGLVEEGLVDHARAWVVPIGVDHRLHEQQIVPSPPRGSDELEGHELIVCIGADFLHKNRLFALEVVSELQRHGWTGRMVLVGPRVAQGSSVPAESEFMMVHPGMKSMVHRLPAVSEAEKAWLFERAALVLYPTTVEGFGLIPFEAARAGIPCVFAPQAALCEVLPAALARIVPWDAAATADAVFRLLHDEEERARLTSQLLSAGEAYRWDTTASRLFEVYSKIVDAEPRMPFSAAAYDPTITATGRQLVGRGGLSRETQLMLRALFARPMVGKPILGGLTLAYRFGRTIAKRDRDNDDTVLSE